MQFAFDFYRSSLGEFALNLKGDFGFGLLGNPRPVQTKGILGNELNIFCIGRWS